MERHSTTLPLADQRLGQKVSFTLIELLVVIAVLAVLMAMLLPVLHTARERAKRASCASRWRQYAAVIHAYAIENDAELPETGEEFGHARDKCHTWEVDYIAKLDPFMGSWIITDCPNYNWDKTFMSDTIAQQKRDGTLVPPYQTGSLYLGQADAADITPAWTVPKRISNSGGLVLITDRNTKPETPYLARYTHAPSGWLTMPSGTPPAGTKADGGNNAWLDGSVHWVRAGTWTERRYTFNPSATAYW